MTGLGEQCCPGVSEGSAGCSVQVCRGLGEEALTLGVFLAEGVVSAV